MPRLSTYHRPHDVAEAISLLDAGCRRVLLAGGTNVVPRSNCVEVIDLQALGLSGVTPDGERLEIGAMTRLQSLVEHSDVPVLLADLARRELPSLLRNQATVGGTVATAESTSVLLAGLLVHGATVSFHDGTSEDLAETLDLGCRGRIITAVSVETTGFGTIAATGRTPADEPIVAAVGRGVDGTISIALTGVARTPQLIDPTAALDELSPTGDFRGSAQYRRRLAGVLVERVMKELS